MARLKKSKFRMDIYIGDNMLSLSVFISEREFNKFLADLEVQHSKHDISNEFFTEYHCRVLRDCESEKVIEYVFEHGMSAIYLTEYRAKDGYCYKK